ncbi:MAG: hypothetical protein K0R23_3208, partial [Lacrimispora sp.]|nr:hypothetical protein [Lacrimispora sp.]
KPFIKKADCLIFGTGQVVFAYIVSSNQNILKGDGLIEPI